MCGLRLPAARLTRPLRPLYRRIEVLTGSIAIDQSAVYNNVSTGWPLESASGSSNMQLRSASPEPSTRPAYQNVRCTVNPGIMSVQIIAILLSCGPLSVAQPAPAGRARREEFFAQARRYLARGDLAHAREAALAVLQTAPQSYEGYDLLGIIYTQQKDYDHAVEAFQHALRVAPGSVATHNNLANCYAEQQRMDLAEKEYQASLRIDAHGRDANYNLGVILLGRNQPDRAISYFSKVTAPDLATQLNLLRAYLRSGQRGKGIELAARVSRRGGDDVRLHYSLGVVLAAENQFQEAEHELKVADGLTPGRYEILYNLGRASLHCKHYGAAEEAFNRALGVMPDSVDAMVLAAQVYIDQQKVVDAIQVLVKARKLAPQNTEVIFLLARVSMLEFYYEDAIPLLEEGIRLASARPEFHAALGECYFMSGKVDKAVPEFEILLRLNPSATSYLFMGLCYRHLGRFDEAKKYFNEGLRLDSHNSACLFNLGYVAEKQGNLTDADKYLTGAVKIEPDFGEALVELASVKMAQKKYEEALPLLRHAVKVSKDPGPVYYKLATAERSLHMTEAAQRDFKVFQTLARNPSSAPYPYQHLFEFAGERQSLPPHARLELDLKSLQREVAVHPEEPRNLYILAETYLKLGRREEALNTIGRLDQLSQQDLRTELGIGVLLARFKLYGEAIRHFQLALDADPSSDEARYDLADAYFHLRNYRRAFEVLQQDSRSAGKDDSYLLLLGDIEAHTGRLDDALQILRQAVERNPDNDQYYLTLAMTCLRKQNLDEAQRVLRQGLARAPDSARILWGLGVLSVLKGDNQEAEQSFVKATDLMPEWVSGFSALGFFYSQTGQITKARETLQRFKTVNRSGELDVSRIEQMLDQEFKQNNSPGSSHHLSPEARLQFLQVALALADRDL